MTNDEWDARPGATESALGHTRHSSLVTRHLVVPLLGHPVAHSLSPAFQDAAFAHGGIAARYELWDVEPGDLAAAVARPRAAGRNGRPPCRRRCWRACRATRSSTI